MSTETTNLLASLKAHRGLRTTGLIMMAALAGVEVFNILAFFARHLGMYWR